MPYPVAGRVGALVPAAGSGSRLGGEIRKALREIAGTPMLVHAVRSLTMAPDIEVVVVAAPAADVDRVRALLGPGVTVVAGGATRGDSVRCALAALPADVDIVLVHDAARPFVPASVVAAVVAAVRAGHGAVVPVLPVTDTIKRVAADGAVLETLDRSGLCATQTPQGFSRALLVDAHTLTGPAGTDDAVLVERLGEPVWTVPGADEAFKVTRPDDLRRAEATLAGLRLAGRDD